MIKAGVFRLKDEVFLKEMGERISLQRKTLKLTQEELAEKMKVSIQMISNLKLGKKAIRPDNLAKISSILNISTDYILKGEETTDLFKELYNKIHRLPKDKLDLVNEVVDLCLEDNSR